MRPGLSMPDFAFTGSHSVVNRGMMVAETWNGVPALSEADRNRLPVLHTVGYANAMQKFDPDTTPAPLLPPPGGLSIWFEPPKYWGRATSPMKPIKSMGLSVDAPTWEDFYTAQNTALDDAGITRFWYANFSLQARGFLITPFPWTEASEPPEIEDPSKFIGGEMLYIHDLNVADNYDPGDPALVTNHITQVVPALLRMERLAYRIYGFAGISAPTVAFYNSVVAEAVAAGIDIAFDSTAISVAKITANYEAFFDV